jgi:hypothetical protein
MHRDREKQNYNKVPYISGTPIKKAKNKPSLKKYTSNLILRRHSTTSRPPITINLTHEDATSL